MVALVKTVSTNDRLRALDARLAALELRGVGAPGAAPHLRLRRHAPPPEPHCGADPGCRRRRGRATASAAASAAASASAARRHCGTARACRQLRGEIRHPLDRLDRRRGAGAGRHLPRQVFHRGRADRAAAAAVLRRAARGGAGRRRRMDAAAGEAVRLCRTDRAYPEHPHRRRHHRRLRHRLCGLRALRLPRSGVRLRAARRGGAGDARRGAAARPGAGRARAWSAPM